MKVKKRFSRLLVVTPIDKVEETKLRVELILGNQNWLPEYIKTPDFEGFAFSWPLWYGLGLSLNEASRLKSYFTSRIELDTGEDPMYIEWMDEDRWRWIEDEDEINDQICSNIYREGEDSLTVYRNFIRFNTGRRGITELTFSEIAKTISKYERDIKDPDLGPWEDTVSLDPEIEIFKNTLKILCRRGFFNKDSGINNNSVYRYVGWDWEI